jgi:hypothetical protein
MTQARRKYQLAALKATTQQAIAGPRSELDFADRLELASPRGFEPRFSP